MAANETPDVLKLKKMQEKEKISNKPVIMKVSKTTGNVINSISNIFLALEHDTNLANTFKYNEFTQSIDVVKDHNYNKGNTHLKIEKGQFRDEFVSSILMYLENVYGKSFSKDNFYAALDNAAHNHSYNPLRDYMDEAYKLWLDNGKHEILKDLLPIYLGADNNKTIELQTKLFFVGAVAKVYDPKSKFDYVLDLVGGQGTGKTTFLTNMAPSVEYYTDQFTDFRDKDSYAVMLRALIVNDDEMTATNKSSFDDLKKFISARELDFRPPYGRYNIRRPKSFVLARTTNEVTYLKDKTGERRFLPILVHPDQQILSPVTDLSRKEVKEFWGEAVGLYKNGFSFILTEKQKKMIEKNRMQFMYIDQQEEEIELALQRLNDHEFITSKEIADEIGEHDLVKNRKLAQKIKYVMDNRKDYKFCNKRIDGYTKRGYRKN
ncbi:VapE domain-containing protein [Fructilactobacillus sp. Tb1]|uniref:VapE domain-containing protein n=1 Tax=Fructilactobacillus sp. Tb1 TaxID=3422304 RepID=UPI003D28FCDC